jgi:hypothetical protein
VRLTSILPGLLKSGSGFNMQKGFNSIIINGNVNVMTSVSTTQNHNTGGLRPSCGVLNDWNTERFGNRICVLLQLK